MAKRSPHIPFGNIEQVAHSAGDPRKTVRFYERLFGFVIERSAKAEPAEPRPLVLKKRNRGLQLLRKLGEQHRFAKTVGATSLRAGLRRIAFKSGYSAGPQDFRDANGTTLVPVPPLARKKTSASASRVPPPAPRSSRKRKLKQ